MKKSSCALSLHSIRATPTCPTPSGIAACLGLGIKNDGATFWVHEFSVLHLEQRKGNIAISIQ